VLEECARFHPTTLSGVPYFFDRVYRALCERGAQNTPGALRHLLGGEIRFCNSGGAALPAHVYDFFHSQGVPLLEGYGLSESSPVITLSTVDHVRRGAVGRTIDGVEVQIAPDGEILTRGPHVMLGYYRNPAATAEVIRDGWLHTGDLGRLDDDRFLYITGRKKEILVLSNGKNIAPAYLEALLTADPAIAQALVIGDGRNYLAALIVPNAAHRDVQELLASPDAHGRWQQIISDRLKDCSHHEQVRRFAVLPRPFSIEEGELTPKLSLRRAVICAHFADEIKALYASNATA
jgi:long-chain acyl-CoA synthetase